MEVSGKKADITEVGAAKELEELLVCEVCEADHVTTKAKGICRECDQFMCDTCFRHHLKVKACRQHVLEDTNLSRTPVQRSSENIENCKRHANEKIKYYCRKHDTVGCGDCMIPVHGPCKPGNIKDLSKQFHTNKDFQSLMKKLQDLTKANNDNDKKIQLNKKTNTDMIGEALKDIKTFRTEINTYLDKAEASIKKDAKEIEQNNNKTLAKLEQDCKRLSSRIIEVRQKLNTEIYRDNALFIQSVNCKPRVVDIERNVLRIQRENDIRTFEFLPDKQLQEIVTSIEKLGSFGRNESKSPAKANTSQMTTEVSRDHTSAYGTQRDPVKEKREKGQEEAKQIAVGARVRPIGNFKTNFFDQLAHKGQPGTVLAVNSDGTVDVQFDATGLTWCGARIGEDFDHYNHKHVIYNCW